MSRLAAILAHDVISLDRDHVVSTADFVANSGITEANVADVGAWLDHDFVDGIEIVGYADIWLDLTEGAEPTRYVLGVRRD